MLSDRICKIYPNVYIKKKVKKEIIMKQYLIPFLVSMVPLIELRGAIPIAQGMGLPIVTSYLVCIIGNMIPVPFIYLFARKVLEWGADKPVTGKFFSFCLEKGQKGGRKLTEKAGRGTFLALLLFVGIPLPGTGADDHCCHAWRSSGRCDHDDSQCGRFFPSVTVNVCHGG